MARRALGPATLGLVRAVQQAVQPADRVLLVACSGGADSLALSAATVEVGRRLARPVAAVVVDHALQEHSAAVAAQACSQLHRLGLGDVVVTQVQVDRSQGAGPEAAARSARYTALQDEAERRGATVLLGHTRNDQAETVLLALARGSGTRSLAGMAVRSGRFLRPLLGVTRVDTERACGELGLDPWQDPHNVDPAYARSRVRSRVLPVLERELGPGIVDSLSRTAQLARDDADLLDELAAQQLPVTEELDCALLAGAPAALRRRAIRSWLSSRGAREVTYGHALAVEQLVIHWHGQQALHLAGVQVARRHGRLVCTS